MVTKEMVVNSSTGLHARPATLLVKRASAFKSNIYIECNDKKANAKSLIGVLSLGVSKGSIITLSINGDDEVYAMDELVKLIETLPE
ncbi:MAG: HPr family phosphocarrier protein [Clostridiaceae bacterium]